jgi:hypothetical protein
MSDSSTKQKIVGSIIIGGSLYVNDTLVTGNTFVGDPSNGHMVELGNDCVFEYNDVFSIKNIQLFRNNVFRLLRLHRWCEKVARALQRPLW